MAIVDIDTLNTSYRELEHTFCQYMAQSCRVQLHLFDHKTGLSINVKKDSGSDTHTLQWTGAISLKMLQSFNDRGRTTDYSAMALAVLLAPLYVKFDYISTSDKGTGVDFFLHVNTDDEDIYGTNNVVAKLEVSGMYEEDNTHKISTRVKEKKEQTKKGTHKHGIAYVSVTEFKTPKSVFEKA